MFTTMLDALLEAAKAGEAQQVEEQKALLVAKLAAHEAALADLAAEIVPNAYPIGPALWADLCRQASAARG